MGNEEGGRPTRAQVEEGCIWLQLEGGEGERVDGGCREVVEDVWRRGLCAYGRIVVRRVVLLVCGREECFSVDVLVCFVLFVLL